MEPYIDVQPKKRGRRKKDEELSTSANTDANTDANNNIHFSIEETSAQAQAPTLAPITNTTTTTNAPINNTIVSSTKESDNKKRGRKPKGGKLILKVMDTPTSQPQTNNIILHLKCSLNELNDYNKTYNQQVSDPMAYNPVAPPEIQTYNDVNSTTPFSLYNDPAPNQIQDAASNLNTAYMRTVCSVCSKVSTDAGHPDSLEIKKEADVQMKDVNAKLKKLKIELYKNAVPDSKKSACFWCTCEYDNQPCYIPNRNSHGDIYGYGSFCRPECAVAYLMKENIDDSAKFDQYNLLNQIYSKIYDYKKNIKPAPNPYFLLDKFYGTLTIQEYRRLLKSEHMLLVIDKPLTRILPELHEDTDEFIMNIYGNNAKDAPAVTRQQQQQGGVYKVKRQSEKQAGPTKASIIQSTFMMDKN